MRSKGLGFRLRRWLGRGTPHSRRTGAGNAIALGEGVFRVTAVPAEEGRNSVSEALEWRRWNGGAGMEALEWKQNAGEEWNEMQRQS
jgi:hypothetical protein